MLERFQLGDSRPLRIGNGWKLPNNLFKVHVLGYLEEMITCQPEQRIRSTWKGLNWMIPNHEYRKHIENNEKWLQKSPLPSIANGLYRFGVVFVHEPHPAVMVKTMVKRWDTYTSHQLLYPDQLWFIFNGWQRWFSWLPMSHESSESFKHPFSSVYFFRGLRQMPNQMEVKGGTGIRKILDMKVGHNVVLSVEVVGGDIGYLRSTCLRGIWIKQVCSWPLTTGALDCSMCYLKEKNVVMPDQMHLFGCAQTSWRFIMWLQGKYIYIYLVCKWEYVIHVFIVVNYAFYLYATKTSGENSMWAMKKPWLFRRYRGLYDPVNVGTPGGCGRC